MPPPYDNIANAFVLTADGASHTVDMDNTGATVETNEGTYVSGPGLPSVWATIDLTTAFTKVQIDWQIQRISGTVIPYTEIWYDFDGTFDSTSPNFSLIQYAGGTQSFLGDGTNTPAAKTTIYYPENISNSGGHRLYFMFLNWDYVNTEVGVVRLTYTVKVYKPPELSSGILLPPAAPGYSRGSKSGVCAVSAGTFIASARSGLSLISDPNAPGPSQVEDQQSAASSSVALDTITLDPDVIGLKPNEHYKMVITYTYLGTGSGRIAVVRGNGTIVNDPYILATPSGQILFNSGGLYAEFDADSSNPAVQWITARGQTVKIRAFNISGSGSIRIDNIFFFTNPSTYAPIWGASGSLTFPNYTNDPNDCYVPGLHNGMFSPSNSGGVVLFSDGIHSQPDPNGAPPVDFVDLGIDAGNVVPGVNRMFVIARVADPTKGVGKIVAASYNYPGPSPVVVGAPIDIPADGNVYVMNLDNVAVNLSSHGIGYMIWASNVNQQVHADMWIRNLADPIIPVVPGASILYYYRDGAWHQANSEVSRDLYYYKDGAWHKKGSESNQTIKAQFTGTWSD